jgi:hypothetical protein
MNAPPICRNSMPILSGATALHRPPPGRPMMVAGFISISAALPLSAQAAELEVGPVS